MGERANIAARGSRKHTGPLRFAWAVAVADIDKGCKLVLFALSPHLDCSAWTCWPSVGRIARNAGLTDRSVQSILKRLNGLGIVNYDRQSRGGCCHQLRVDLERLESLACPEPVSGSNPEAPACEPRSGFTVTPKPVHRDPEAVSEKQTKEQTNQQTTTTTTQIRGGGGCERSDWVEQLIAAGVSRRDAEQASRLPDMSEDRIAFAIDVGGEPSSRHPGRLITSLLRKPVEELDGFELFVATRVHQKQSRLQHVMEHARGWAAPEDARKITTAFPTALDMLESGAVRDRELLVRDPDPRSIFAALLRAAEDRSGARSTESLGQSVSASDFPPANAAASVPSTEEGR